MFDNEFDMLDCRLHELSGLVDLFIVCEADHSFTGIPKAYHLTEALQQGRYADAPIEVMRARTGDTGNKAMREWITPETRPFWWREMTQRRAANERLKDLPEDTIVMYGDLDEIPSRASLQAWDGIPRVMVMRLLIYSLKSILPSPWAGTVIGTIDRLGPDPHTIRETRWSFPIMDDAGWHLSWFGGPERRELKYTHQAHQELFASGKLMHDYPSKMIHVDGQSLLFGYDGPRPKWAEEGYAPSYWWNAA